MFALSYQSARSQFLAASSRVGCQIYSYPHPLKGRDGEDLALDVAVFGASASSKQRVLVSSGCHGVEGYCGSGIQVAALGSESLLAYAKAQNIALIFAHALNPYGFSHIRRATEDNVDLNRNFPDFSQALPVNEAYAEFHEVLFPEQWPPSEQDQAHIDLLFNKYGMPFAQKAITSGQYTHPEGLHYGGTQATWSHINLRQVLRDHGQGASSLAWIDLHSGLGPSGHGERIFSPSVLPRTPENINALYERANHWWGGNGATRLTRFDDGTSSSAPLSGTLSDVASEECPQAQITKVTLEFGTKRPREVLQAMCAEQWLQLHPEAPPEQQARIKQDMLDAFFVNTQAWQAQVTAQGLEVIQQAIKGISS